MMGSVRRYVDSLIWQIRCEVERRRREAEKRHEEQLQENKKQIARLMEDELDVERGFFSEVVGDE